MSWKHLDFHHGAQDGPRPRQPSTGAAMHRDPVSQVIVTNSGNGMEPLLLVLKHLPNFMESRSTWIDDIAILMGSTWFYSRKQHGNIGIQFLFGSQALWMWIYLLRSLSKWCRRSTATSGDDGEVSTAYGAYGAYLPKGLRSCWIHLGATGVTRCAEMTSVDWASSEASDRFWQILTDSDSCDAFGPHQGTSRSHSGVRYPVYPQSCLSLACFYVHHLADPHGLQPWQQWILSIHEMRGGKISDKLMPSARLGILGNIKGKETIPSTRLPG